MGYADLQGMQVITPDGRDRHLHRRLREDNTPKKKNYQLSKEASQACGICG